jgi:biotin carboxyl carrier protein
MAAFRITVNGHAQFPLQETDIQDLDIIKTDENRFHILERGKSFKARVSEVDMQKKTITFRLAGRKYVVQIEDELDLLVKKMGLSSTVIHKIKDVKSPMPGLVLELLVKPGDTVQSGDSLLILEAMKMENIIKSPGDGTVKAIKVAKGAPVDKGAILIELE